MNLNAKITGLGFRVPDTVWDNDKLAEIVDTSDEWIRTRTGIVTRCIAAEDESTATLGADAANAALADAGMDAKDVDLVIVATMSPEMMFPATACFVQDAIGAVNAGAMDVGAACTGFIYGLSVAAAMVSAGMMKNVLVVGAETLSRVIDWNDRASCVLFGDGAGAAVVSSEGEGGRIKDVILKADGSRIDLLYMPAGGARQPATVETVEQGLHFMKMTGKGLYKEASNSMADAVREVLERNGKTLDDMDILIPHQANQRIIAATAKRLDMPAEKAYVNIDKYGNTSAATIPIAMTEAREEGLLDPGSTAVLVAFGSGMTWGSALIEY